MILKMSEKRTATLLLEDGSRFEGFSFGADHSTSGEVVFSTAMVGYPESLTDPSFRGQILVMTYPLVGNYGVPSDERDEHGLMKFFESEGIHVRALVVTDYSFEYSHWNAVRSLSDWLREHDITAIYGVDTRQVTKLIREKGVMMGAVDVEGTEPARIEKDPNEGNMAAEVSCKEVTEYGKGKYRIVLVDCGCKTNIIRRLLLRDVTVVRVPWDYDFTTLDYDGVMLSNGPGDPAKCTPTIENIKKAIAIGKPIFGICLGNQLLSIAAGAKTFKLKYGHRSHNQPVLQVGTDKALITSQNHGFAADTSTLEAGWEPFFINLNDGTSEGIRHTTQPFCSVQFHPEASSGPLDADFLFDNFIEQIATCKK